VRLIPAIDLQAGRCVRLLRGDFDAPTNYPAEPQALLACFRDVGAKWLHVVDLDGARNGNRDNRLLIAQLAAQNAVKLQVGGGLRNSAALVQMLDAGVARVVVGSAAVSQVEQVLAWLKAFGADRVTLAFDVRMDESGTPRVATHGWQQRSQVSLWSALAPYSGSDLRHVLCTDIDRDGALSGPNVELYADAVRRHPQVEWQASGGIRSSADLHALARIGASAAISGKALLEKLIPVAELQPFLPNA
jgi:phosphoribosylformimino-5-aminoimidazole carboxamide ribotide isomerase